ncbi:Biotin/lipoate A/B protein ligase, partial [Ascosphaera atra]
MYQSDDWRYNQTPQFTFSTETAHDTPGKEVVVPSGLPTDTSVYLDVKSGAIRSAKLSTRSHPADVKEKQATSFDAAVKGRRICEISDWRDVLATSGALDDEARPGESER